MPWYMVLGYLSGLRLISADLDPLILLRTALLVNTCDAIMCRLFAHNNGYPKNLWTVLGLIFGIWSLAVLLMLPKRRHPPQ